MRPLGKLLTNIGFAIGVAIFQPAVSQVPPYSTDEAIALVKQKVDGRILKVLTTQQDDRTVYEIRVLTPDGTVRTIRVDEQNGIEE